MRNITYSYLDFRGEQQITSFFPDFSKKDRTIYLLFCPILVKLMMCAIIIDFADFNKPTYWIQFYIASVKLLQRNY